MPNETAIRWPTTELLLRRSGPRVTPVGAAAALHIHGQGGYLAECIRGERTALRQAVHPNGIQPSLLSSLAAMRPTSGKINIGSPRKGCETPRGRQGGGAGHTSL